MVCEQQTWPLEPFLCYLSYLVNDMILLFKNNFLYIAGILLIVLGMFIALIIIKIIAGIIKGIYHA